MLKKAAPVLVGVILGIVFHNQIQRLPLVSKIPTV